MDNLWKILTFTVAALGWYVAYRQFHVSREKLKLDLFEKRYEIFKITKTFLSKIGRDGSTDFSAVLEFKQMVAESPFLFEDDVTSYLDEIGRHAAKLNTAIRKLDNLPAGEQRDEQAECEAEELTWLTDQLGVLVDRFSPYLKFHTWQNAANLPQRRDLDSLQRAMSQVLARAKRR